MAKEKADTTSEVTKPADNATSEPKKDAKPEQKSGPRTQSMVKWSVEKRNQPDAVGAAVRFKIDLKSEMTEKEYDNLVDRFRNDKK